MSIFITASTEFELHALQSKLVDFSHEIEFHVTGVGILESTFKLTELTKQNPELIIQIGIAGAYFQELAIGECVLVNSELLADQGAEDHENFLDVFDLNLQQPNKFPFSGAQLRNPWIHHYPNNFKQVLGATVNLSAGKLSTIELRKNKFKADIETMEGAALHYVCLQKNIPFLQFRAISNYVEPRNKDNWEIELALQNLSNQVSEFIINQL